MVRRLALVPVSRHHASRSREAPAGAVRCLCHSTGDFPMQWQTPTATDFRFGFEITMYVAAR